MVEADPSWPAVFASLEQRIRTALGDVVVAVEDVGSTAVPGLPAKPIIDIDAPATNVHVFSPGSPEVVRHQLFRDWLREHPDDLTLYRDTKVAAAAASNEAGEHVMEYSARKESVIHEIYGRVFRGAGLL